MKKRILSVLVCFLAPTMMLGSIFGLTEGTIKYVEWILYWTGNVSLVVAIVASFGASASIGTLIYSYIKKKGIKWTVIWIYIINIFMVKYFILNYYPPL